MNWHERREFSLLKQEFNPQWIKPYVDNVIFFDHHTVLATFDIQNIFYLFQKEIPVRRMPVIYIL